jgi:hypothetical protein
MKKIINNRVGVINILALITIIAIFCFDPIAQDQSYHKFADTRAYLGLENFFDVMSNFPFILLGAWGLYFITKEEGARRLFYMSGEKTLWQIFFLGVFLVGFGSGYYHLDTNNASIIWDRIPITISFMSLFSLIIMERIDGRFGLILSPILLVSGIVTVFYWYYTELLGRGDLRAYVLIQLIPLMLIPIILWMFTARYTQSKYLLYSLGWYVIAKLLELLDQRIFEAFGGISGHTLKHLAVACGIYAMLLYLKNRELLGKLRCD